MSEILDDPPATDVDRSTDTARGAATGWWWAGLRPLVLRLHFYVGLFVGPFILVAAVTGLVYTITPQLDQLVYRDALTVPVGTTQLALRDQVAAAAQAVPDGTVTEIRPPVGPASTTRVTFDAPGVREDFARTAFVDPYTGNVRSVLDTYGEWLPVRAWIDELHRTLHLGDIGRVYSELAASWLWVLALSGLAIWTMRRRRSARLRRTLLPQHSARGRVRLRSWHGAVGVWIAIGMLFLSATGLTWSHFAGDNVTALRTALDWSTPSVSQDPPAGTVITAAPSTPAEIGATADRVLAGARAAGIDDPVAITPGEPGQAWSVAQVQRFWPVKQDAVAVNPDTGAIVETLRFADWPVAGKLAEWGIDAHMGLLFGWVNQLLLIALALGIICVVVWGYRMWWLRRPTRATPTGPPGGNRPPSTGAVLVVALVALGLGVFLPVMGLSLLAFLIGDAAWQRLRPAE